MRDALPKVKRILAETLAIDAADIRDEARLIDYGLDSVRAVDLIISLEENFGIRVKEEDVAEISTVRDLAAYVKQRVEAD